MVRLRGCAMTVKITTPGKLPETIARQGKCNNCKCEITCMQGDCQVVPSGAVEDDYTVPCPTNGCGYNIVTSLAPHRMRRVGESE